ncbi:protein DETOXIFICATION 12-like isoform X1 [Citrus sinensis]|uniref:protein DETOXIFICATION 12-like isoform X1 n=2 Tax=Citrus sinensis TaxID=2711 RepID=UPI002277B00F|nr:protein DETOXIFICATION 12-like isoform X1 [Citrus sinensis]XP_052289165.1 protein DETOXIFICATION 12-like isoform X1 [Citrus sinensis]
MRDNDTEKNMEESLLIPKESLSSTSTTWDLLSGELKKQGYIAAPMVAVTLSQYLLQVVSMMMVGHLRQLALSSTAMAISLASVTGFSVLLGMASALETLCGQAYGAQQYQRIGTQIYTAIFCLFLVCFPLSFLGIYMGRLLVLVGQDPQISHEVGKFIIWLLPALFAYAAMQALIRYFQSQSLIIPMFLSSYAALCLHICICWGLVFKSGLGNLGIGEFFQFAIPSAVMVCLEWWSFELLILMSGLLPNPQLETSVLSVCLSTIQTLSAIPYGLGAAVSTRVSNELGAGNVQRARVAVYAVVFMAVMETIIASASLFASWGVFGYVFSNEGKVVDYVITMAPLVCLSVIMDSLQGLFSGVARGCGWQNIAAFVNLGAYYLCGVPTAAILGFWLKFRGRGLWIGIQAGAFTQTLLLGIITTFTDWEKQASKARKRLSKGRSLEDNRIVCE